MIRFLIPLFLLLTYLSCSKSTAGLTIPARNMFTLGEYMTSGYSATVTNRGVQTVRLQIVTKSDLDVIQEFDLAPEVTERVTVSPDEQVQMLNAGERDAELLVVMTKGVDGMQLQALDGAAPVDSEPNRKITLPALTANFTSPPADRFRPELSAGSCYLIGEGAELAYTATVKSRGGTVKLRVLRESDSDFVLGFGLGGGSTETINVGSGEVLYLCNETDSPLRLDVRLSEKVPGGRELTPSR